MSAYDCRDCGACCFSDSDEYVALGAADVERLAPERDLVRRVSGRLYLRMSKGRCHALAPGPSGLACTVYAERPAACRELQAGSPECLAERREKRERALRCLDAQAG